MFFELNEETYPLGYYNDRLRVYQALHDKFPEWDRSRHIYTLYVNYWQAKCDVFTEDVRMAH